MRRIHYLATAAILALGLAGNAGAATFVIDPNAGTDGTMLFLTGIKDSTTSTGSVAAKKDVGISVVGPSDFASGFANIKPVKGGMLTELTFTPVNANEFNSFAFRGQSLAAKQTLDVIVTDNQGDPAQTLTFMIAKANQDFGFDGIISADGGTIKSVELLLASPGFKEAKQFEFDCVVTSASCPNNGKGGGGGGGVPEPATWALMLIGVSGVGAMMRSRRRALASVA